MNTMFPAMPGTPFPVAQTSAYVFSTSEQPVQDDSYALPSITLPVLTSPSLEHSLDEHVFYYFAQMRSLHPMLVGIGLADVTYSVRAHDHAHDSRTN